MKKLLVFLIFLAVLFTVSGVTATELKEGSTYHETSLNTGNSNTFSSDNPYILGSMEGIVYGYSFRTADGTDLGTYIEETTTSDIAVPPVPTGTVRTSLLLKNSNFLLGWTDSSNTSFSVSEDTKDPPKKEDSIAAQTANDIVEEIKKDKAVPMYSAIIFDLSGSMSSYMEEVYNKIMDSKEDANIIAMYAFASRVSDKIHPKDFNENLWYDLNTSLGSYTNIIGALDKATMSDEYVHIYLLTDEKNNQGSWRHIENHGFAGKITIYKYGGDASDTSNFHKQIEQNFPKAEVEYSK